MKVGDLVKLSMRKTRKGRSYEDTIGVVTSVTKTDNGWTIITTIFDGMPYTFSLSDLEVVSET